jgi:peptidoglycan hydrolase-like protein with peptidoglycan-binding domain
MVTAKTTKSAKRSSHSTVSAHAKSGKHVRHSRRARHKNASWKRRGQQRIAPERAREIQEALIRQNYMEAPATGVWDDSSRQAMIKYQEDHGWQTKSVPDSRALIELGLGPDHDHLINPESAMTMRPHGGIAEKENVSGPAALPQ